MIRDATGRARPNSSAKRSVEKDGHFIPGRNSFILHCYRKFAPHVGAATNDRDFVLSKCGALALLIVRNVASGRDLVSSDFAQSLVSEIDRLAVESVTETRIDAAVVGETAFLTGRSTAAARPQWQIRYLRDCLDIGWKEAKDTCGTFYTALLEIDLARLQKSRREMHEPAITGKHAPLANGPLSLEHISPRQRL